MVDALVPILRLRPASAAIRQPLLSIIVPAFNEAENLPDLYDEVTATMAAEPCRYEVLLIDNASTDGTDRVATGFCTRDERWRYVRMSRNFSVEASMAAGLRLARGDAALVLFSDLQDPPELIPEFLRKWEAGHDIVYGVVRRRADDAWWKSWASSLAYRLIRWNADIPLPADATDFRLYSRRAIDALNQFEERTRYLRGLGHWIGFRSCPVAYDRRPRLRGLGKTSVGAAVNLLVNGLTAFSSRPLRSFWLLGLFGFACTVVLAAFTLVGLAANVPVPSWTSLFLLGHSSLSLFGFGVLGEMLGRIQTEINRRPLYLIERTVNVDSDYRRDSVS